MVCGTRHGITVCPMLVAHGGEGGPMSRSRSHPGRRCGTAVRVVAGTCIVAWCSLAISGLSPVVADAATPTPTAYLSEAPTIAVPNFVDAFDTSSGTWIGPDVPTGGQYPAYGVAVSPDGAYAFVPGAFAEGATKGSLSVISTVTDAATAQIALPDSPTGPIAITPNGKTAYLVAYRDIIPVDLSDDTVGTPIPTPVSGGGGDLGIAITPAGTTAYVPTSALGPCTSLGTCYGVVLPVDLTTATVGAPIEVPDYVGTWPDGYQEALSGGIAVAPQGTTAYVVLNAVGILAPGWVSPIDTATDTVGSPIPAGDSPGLIVVTPNGKSAFVNDSSSDSAVTGVTPIDLSNDTPGTQIPRPDCPSGSASYLGPMAIDPSGTTLYLVCTLDSQLVPIDTTTDTAGAPSASPTTYGSATGIAITPDQAPTAAFTITPAPAGSPTVFNASSSSSPVGTIASYVWTFGDGHTKTTAHPKLTHSYTVGGTYTVTLTVTNSQGTSTRKVFTGNTMSRNGGPSARASRHVTIAAG